MLEEIRSQIASLSQNDRMCLLNELLVAYVKTINDEMFIIDDTGEVIGVVMNEEQRSLLISSELLDRMDKGPYKHATKPMADILKNLPAPVCR